MNEQVLKTSGADVLSSKKKNSKKLYGDGGGGESVQNCCDVVT